MRIVLFLFIISKLTLAQNDSVKESRSISLYLGFGSDFNPIYENRSPKDVFLDLYKWKTQPPTPSYITEVDHSAPLTMGFSWKPIYSFQTVINHPFYLTDKLSFSPGLFTFFSVYHGYTTKAFLIEMEKERLNYLDTATAHHKDFGVFNKPFNTSITSIKSKTIETGLVLMLGYRLYKRLEIELSYTLTFFEKDLIYHYSDGIFNNRLKRNSFRSPFFYDFNENYLNASINYLFDINKIKIAPYIGISHNVWSTMFLLGTKLTLI